MSHYTAAEGRGLSRRLAKVRATGGIPHEAICQETRDDMEHDLRQMVQGYTGAPRQAKQLLEALVIACEAGVEACDGIERDLAERMRKRRAA